ncbi:MAG: hypothetical protein ACLUFH_06895 [Monoglobales bacterium]
MLAPELTKLKEDIEAGEKEIKINRDRLLVELRELENIEGYLYESLALSQYVCPTCGRRLK